MDYILAPSILSADFKVLGEQMNPSLRIASTIFASVAIEA